MSWRRHFNILYVYPSIYYMRLFFYYSRYLIWFSQQTKLYEHTRAHFFCFFFSLCPIRILHLREPIATFATAFRWNFPGTRNANRTFGSFIGSFAFCELLTQNYSNRSWSALRPIKYCEWLEESQWDRKESALEHIRIENWKSYKLICRKLNFWDSVVMALLLLLLLLIFLL